MIDIDNVNNYYLYTNDIDMRMGMYKIQCLLALTFSPIEIINSVFIFVSKNRKTIKIYYENEYGNWLLINKLKYFKFQIGNNINNLTITQKNLNLLLTGAKIKAKKENINYI